MNYYSYIDILAIKAAKYDELKTKIKNIQDTIKSYELNEQTQPQATSRHSSCFLQLHASTPIPLTRPPRFSS